MGSGQVGKTFATVLWGNRRDRAKGVFMGRYGWPRVRVGPAGRFGSEKSLRTGKSGQLDLSGQVNRRGEGNPENSLRDRTEEMECVTRSERVFRETELI